MAESDDQDQSNTFVFTFGADEFTLTPEEIAAMPQVGGYLATVSIALPPPFSFISGSATITTNGEFFTGPGAGWSSPPISVAAGYTTGGPPSAFANEASFLFGAGIVVGITPDGSVKF